MDLKRQTSAPAAFRAGLITTIIAIALAPWGQALAAVAGEVGLVTGRVTAATSAGDIRYLARGDAIYEGEIVSTGPASFVNMKFVDGGRILLRPNTRFEIETFAVPAGAETTVAAAPPAASPAAARPAQTEQEARAEGSGSAFFRLLKGGFRAVTGLVGRADRDAYRVRTPIATIGIRGTDFEARLCAGDCVDIDPLPTDGLYTGVNDGGISLTNGTGEFVSLAGQFAMVTSSGSAVRGLSTRPRVLATDPMPDPETCD
jgi:hypothetical protein